MDVFLMVRRKKTTIFTDAKETTTVRELKKIIQGIMKVEPENQQLMNERGTEIFDDDKQLSDYNLSAQTARAQSPATVALVFRQENGDFEPLDITPLSSPPELPEVMKPQEPQTHDLN
ncbi:LOW QUALITY PROTEIN: elongin-B-like [Penaeus monodon]|uniref:LOW QUALITY PROTEIN: elongin-B-like n=1 Tax=Penaeus monodon TaxID=6687 RepID=UPI0018A7D629|nr:LOW QUALITY PROTEIN: elongin-B-like [Penaeus monodon]XP_047473061.1 elongin-B-like [Penaeus chinensis]